MPNKAPLTEWRCNQTAPPSFSLEKYTRIYDNIRKEENMRTGIIYIATNTENLKSYRHA